MKSSGLLASSFLVDGLYLDLAFGMLHCHASGRDIESTHMYGPCLNSLFTFCNKLSFVLFASPEV